MKKLLSIGLIMLLLTTFIQVNAQDTDSTKHVKTDWNFGVLPTITYNSDLGFQYGLLTNLYYFGDGSTYPAYMHSIYAEVSRYTKGSGIYRLFYDSKYLIEGIRTTFDIHYLPDEALDFYGFNGYQAVFNEGWGNDEDPSYKSRMFYRHKRNIFNGKFDFLGTTGAKNLNWVAGARFSDVVIKTVDIDKLNEGKDAEDILPDTATLYDQYVDWGIIDSKEANGGFIGMLKGGLVYDSRDNEANPMSGLWSEIVLSQAFSNDYTYTKIGITHRQYFTLAEDKLSFAYRLGYQGIIAGESPFYMLPSMVTSFNPSVNNDGLGGSRTVRGVLRNRIVGEGVLFGNVELRWKFTDFRFINQNFYLALAPFADFGKVVKNRDIDKSGIPIEVDQSQYFNAGNDQLHITYGAGFYIAMNQNFVIAANLGIAADEQDGDKGIYIGMNWLF